MNIPGIRFVCRYGRKGSSRPLSIAALVFMAVMLTFTVSAYSAGGGGHDAEPKGWVATDTYRVMNFTVLFVGLFLILRKPVSKALNARIDGIRGQLEELEGKKAAAEKELAGYAERLEKLEGEADAIIEDYKRQGAEAKARILKEAEAAAEKLEEQAKRNIDHEFEQARKQLMEEVLDKAMVRAEEIVASKISDADQERLVDEYLNKVVA